MWSVNTSRTTMRDLSHLNFITVNRKLAQLLKKIATNKSKNLDEYDFDSFWKLHYFPGFDVLNRHDIIVQRWREPF